MSDFVDRKVEQTNGAGLMSATYQVRLRVADQFCDGMLVFRVKAHRVDERFLDLVEEGKGSFVVADDKLVLLGFKPSTAGGDFFIYSRVSRGVRIAARNFSAIL